MTVEEFFDLNLDRYMWVHASKMGVDENGGIWVQLDAELRSELPAIGFKSWVLLTVDRVSGLPGKDDKSPAWKKVQKLDGKTLTGWTKVH